MAFADPIKELALSLGFNKDDVYGTQEQKLIVNQEWGISGRTFMQAVGTDLFRHHISKVLPELKLNERNIWARAVEIKLLHRSSPVVITDVRFPDEAKMIQDLGGCVILIQRNDVQGLSTHSSEMSVNSIVPDLVIENNGTLEAFNQKIEQLL